MEYNYSALWISLLNSVFASIAFIVWYFLSIEEKAFKQPKEIEIVEVEEEQEDTREERHLYIKDGKIVNYPELYLRRTEEEQYKEIRPKPRELEEKMAKETVQAASLSSKPFQWPRQDDVIESLRSLQGGGSISAALQEKLQDHGILRSAPTQDDGSRLATRAQVCGRQVPRKRIFIGFDNFSSVSRPGLEHASSPDTSPGPAKPRLVMRRVNMEDRGRRQGARRNMVSKINQQECVKSVRTM